MLSFLLLELDTGYVVLRNTDPVIRRGIIDSFFDMDGNQYYWDGNLSFTEETENLVVLDEDCKKSILASDVFGKALLRFLISFECWEENKESLRKFANYLRS